MSEVSSSIDDLWAPLRGIADDVEIIREEMPSLRDFFAATALQGMLGNANIIKEQAHDPLTIASYAYRYADAMLQEREKKVE